MRPELTEIQIIEKFILGQLSPENDKKVKEKIKNDSEFAKKAEKQQLIVEANKNLGLKQTAKKSHSKFKLKKFLKIGLPTFAAVAVGGYFLATSLLGGPSMNPSENIKYALNENGTEEWADADLYVKPQFFTVNADQDNVVVGEDGTVVAIPGGALLDANGNPVSGKVEIELKEAINPEDIIAGGLSTMSGDDVLETGGMVYFNARKDGESLTIDPEKEIALEIPSDEVKEGMMLYEGKRTENGGLDWQNPVELNRDLTTVDIHSLNFWPKGYEAEVERLGYLNKSKEWLDSLYYSFALVARRDAVWEDDFKIDSSFEKSLWPMGVWECSECRNRGIQGVDPAKIKSIWNDKFKDTYIATKEFEERLQMIFSVSGGDGTFLDMYLENIDKPLYYTDSIIVELCGSLRDEPDYSIEVPVVDSSGLLFAIDNTQTTDSFEGCDPHVFCERYFQFASERTGGVKVSSEAISVLHNFYRNIAAAQRKAARKVQDQFNTELADMRQKHTDIKGQEIVKDAENYEKMYYEELNYNIKEVASQLGIQADAEFSPGEAARRGYTASTSSTGWLNIDRQIRAALDKRETVEVELDGIKAKVEYSAIDIEVPNEDEFDRVNVYLLPKQFSSYQRITKRKHNFYTETLNEFVQYDLLVVGFKGDKISLKLENNISEGGEKTEGKADYVMELESSSMERLNVIMSESGKGNIREKVTSTIKNQIEMQFLQEKMERYKDKQKFRNELAETLFPCHRFPYRIDFTEVSIEPTKRSVMRSR